MSPLILFQYGLSLCHTSSLGGAPEVMRLKRKEIHKNLLLFPKWRILLTSALLAPEFIAIRGTVCLLVAECRLKCMFNFGSSIEGPE
jgi:hypothetical protein